MLQVIGRINWDQAGVSPLKVSAIEVRDPYTAAHHRRSAAGCLRICCLRILTSCINLSIIFATLIERRRHAGFNFFQGVHFIFAQPGFRETKEKLAVWFTEKL